MFKLLIVDDEGHTREGLMKIVPWQDLGIHQIFEADDGLSALHVFEQENPDIVLCDVRMPRMDGITFAERIREKNDTCKIIFLSGFSDKPYLKSAIRLGAVDYIEKPVVIPELLDVVRSAIELCRQEKEKRKQEADVLQQLTDSRIKKRREWWFLNLLHPDSEIFTSGQQMSDPEGKPFASNAFTAAVTELNWDSGVSNRLKDERIASILGEPLMSGFLSDSQFVVLLNEQLGQNGLVKERFIQLLTETLDRHNFDNAFKYAIGIGKSVQGLPRFPESLHTAVKAASLVFYAGYGKVFFYETLNLSRFEADEQMLDLFKNQMAGNNRAEAESVIHRLTSELSRHQGTDVDYAKHLYLNLFLVICRTADARNLNIENEERTKRYFWKEISEFTTLKELAQYLLNEVKSFFNAFEDQDTAGSKAYEIMNIIEKQFGDMELSVTSVAQQVHLSLNYMCGLFKKKTGKTVNDFIQEVRLRQACGFLQDRDIKVYEVAERAGYADSNYFTRTFKKEMGLTPSEYRLRYLR